MSKIIPLETKDKIPVAIRNSPIEDLILYHNFNESPKVYTKADMLISTCMDHRISLNIPKNFAYVIRTGAANISDLRFKVSFATAVGGVRHMAIIGHTQCGMRDLALKRDDFITGLISIGLEQEYAEHHFHEGEAKFGIQNEAEFVLDQCKQIKTEYPKVFIAPLIYKVEDHRLYYIQ